MVKVNPLVSVIIPTYNSSKVLKYCLNGLKNQNYPRGKIEIIVVDNASNDNTKDIALSYGAKVILISGKPPKVCEQRNLGASEAIGQYLMFLDHDMEITHDLIEEFANKSIAGKNKADAWYIPEKVIASNKIFSNIRTFERSFYNGTIVDAVRIIKRSIFYQTKRKYDPLLSSGPADWDLDIQLREIGCLRNSLTSYLTHHEENLSFWKYISKKNNYLRGIEIYKNIWKSEKSNYYDLIVKRQFSLYYRYFGVFIENNKWKKILSNPLLTIGMLFIRFLIGLKYLLGLIKKNTYESDFNFSNISS